MDILNFISWIRGARKVNSVDPNKTLIPFGTKDPRRDDKYLSLTMSVTDFTNQIAPGMLTAAMWASGFINTGCIASNISLPDNATFDYNGPLTMCTGYTLTIPANTTLTVL